MSRDQHFLIAGALAGLSVGLALAFAMTTPSILGACLLIASIACLVGAHLIGARMKKRRWLE